MKPIAHLLPGLVLLSTVLCWHAEQARAAEPVEIEVEVKIVEITEPADRAAGFSWLLDPAPARAGKAPPSPAGSSSAEADGDTRLSAPHMLVILTPAQTKAALAALDQRPGASLLSAPKLTTLSGRQAQIKVVEVKHIVTDVERGFDSKGVAQEHPIAEPFELGPVVDLTPSVSPDLSGIHVRMQASLKEFLGYDPAKRPKPAPRFRERKAACALDVPDRFTAIVSGGSIVNVEEKVVNAQPVTLTNRTSLLFFVTPSIVQPGQ